MLYNRNSIIIIITFLLLQINTTSAQVNDSGRPQFEVNTVYKPLSISKDTLLNAQTINDLNKHFKPKWIREFYSVDITTIKNGKINKSKSKNDVLTDEQKENMRHNDVGTEISIAVNYLPENTLKNNDPKTFNFSFVVNPETEATYPGGKEKLLKYFDERVIHKIPTNTITGYAMSAVKFTITESGQIHNVHVFETSKDKAVDALMVEAICDMATWKPAVYDNGIKTSQEFVLMVGSMESCIINTLNIGRLNIPEE